MGPVAKKILALPFRLDEQIFRHGQHPGGAGEIDQFGSPRYDIPLQLLSVLLGSKRVTRPDTDEM